MARDMNGEHLAITCGGIDGQIVALLSESADRVIALDVRREWCLGRVTKLRFQRKKNHPRKASKAVTAVLASLANTVSRLTTDRAVL